jgi:hypothetical protein
MQGQRQGVYKVATTKGCLAGQGAVRKQEQGHAARQLFRR